MKSESHFGESQSVTAIVGNIVGDVQQLLRQELALAKTEMKQEWGEAKKAAWLVAAAYALLTLGGGLLAFGLVHALAATGIVPLWASYGIFALLFIGVGLMFLGKGRDKAKSVDVIPKETVETMRENVQWLKKRI